MAKYNVCRVSKLNYVVTTSIFTLAGEKEQGQKIEGKKGR